MSLPQELIRKAKVVAAERDQSLSALLRESLESLVEARNRSRRAGERLLRKSRSGLYEIPPPAPGIVRPFMSERAFFDSNVLLSLYHRRDAFKRERAAETFRAALESRNLVISTQMFQEFYAAVTRKQARRREKPKPW